MIRPGQWWKIDIGESAPTELEVNEIRRGLAIGRRRGPKNVAGKRIILRTEYLAKFGELTMEPARVTG